MSARQRLLLVLWAAGAVSVACNILAAEPTAVGRAVAAWPPVALLLVVEVLARSPLPSGRLRWAAVAGAAVVASVAAIASFHHMHEVATMVGESPLVAVLFPLSVDGLAVVASVALVGSSRHDDRPAAPLELEPAAVEASQPHLSPAATESPAGWSLLTGASSPVPPGAGSPTRNGSTNNHTRK